MNMNMEESQSETKESTLKWVLWLLGLNEETVEEVGGSYYVHPMIVCVLRCFMGVLNIVALFLLFMDVKKGGFRLFWDIPLRSRWVGIEMWSSAFAVVSSFLRGYVSGQATIQDRNFIVARIAGPLSFAALTLAIFSTAVSGRVKLTWDRNIIYGFPLLAVFLEIALGSKNRYRVRAIGIPLGAIQMQQAIASIYLWIYKPKYIGFKLRFLALGIAYNIVGAVCALSVIGLSKCTALCSRAPKLPQAEDTGTIFAVRDI